MSNDSAFAAILSSLPVDSIAAQVGADPEQVRSAAAIALPALIGGLAANAEDPAGEASLATALRDHTDDVSADGQVDLAKVNTEDGEKITRHVFGDNTDQVVNQLGSVPGASSSLVKKLLPILAPIVLSYLAKQLSKSSGGAVGGGLIGQILQQIIAGAAQGAGSPASAGTNAGSILGDVLGGLLGAGRRQ